MQIFEFHFNPKLKETHHFDTFAYEPESSYEKKLGSLHMVGQINTPKNQNIIEDIAQIFKKNYYSLSIKSPEKALSNASKKVNEFLSEEVKKENVDWMGNLNFAVISIREESLTFTKTGDIKLVLIRENEIIDIGKNLESQEIDPYPLKVFFNVVSGKLTENDKLLMITKSVYNFFLKEGVLNKLTQKEITQKNIKKIIPKSQNLSGACFLTILNDKEEKNEPILFKEDNKRPFWNKFKLPKFKKSSQLPKIKIKRGSHFIEKLKAKNSPSFKKRILPVLSLMVILLIGAYIIKPESEKKPEVKPEISAEEKARLETLYKLEKVNNPELTNEKIIFTPDYSHLNPPPFQFNRDIVTSYYSNFYFVDQTDCKVVKYPHLRDSTWGNPKIWKNQDNYCSNPKDLAIDGSVYILNSDNSIAVYHSGEYQETITIGDIYPEIKGFNKIETKPNVPYLYLLEPENKRVVIINKEDGRIMKQLQSDSFNNLKDIQISDSGETIYLLNGIEIYKINLTN